MNELKRSKNNINVEEDIGIRWVNYYE